MSLKPEQGKTERYVLVEKVAYLFIEKANPNFSHNNKEFLYKAYNLKDIVRPGTHFHNQISSLKLFQKGVFTYKQSELNLKLKVRFVIKFSIQRTESSWTESNKWTGKTQIFTQKFIKHFTKINKGLYNTDIETNTKNCRLLNSKSIIIIKSSKIH